MTTYTKFTELSAKHFIAFFKEQNNIDLGELKSPPEPLANGISNSVYKVRTTKGDFVFRIFESVLDPKDLGDIHRKHAALKKIKEAGLPVPKLFGDITTFIGRDFQVMEFVPGKNMSDFEMTPQIAFNLGKFLGMFHAKASQIDLGLEAPEAVVRTSMLAKIAGRAVKEVTTSIKQFFSMSPDQFLELSLKKFNTIPSFIRGKLALKNNNIPQGFTHRDPNRGNVIMHDDGVTPRVLIDFDSMGKSYFIIDVADAFTESLVPPQRKMDGLKPESVYMFLAGYNEERKLEPSELKILPEILRMTAKLHDFYDLRLNIIGKKKHSDGINKYYSYIQSVPAIERGIEMFCSEKGTGTSEVKGRY